MKTKEQELKEALEQIKSLVKNVESKIEALKLEKEDKFAEIKEAHKNGAEIEFFDALENEWYEAEVPVWNENLEYRIKPEEKPKIGDVCKFWNDDVAVFVIGVLTKVDESIYPYSACSKYWYKNAKKLSKQEAIELLFGSED